jgi:hypothetical protein
MGPNDRRDLRFSDQPTPTRGPIVTRRTVEPLDAGLPPLSSDTERRAVSTDDASARGRRAGSDEEGQSVMGDPHLRRRALVALLWAGLTMALTGAYAQAQTTSTDVPTPPTEAPPPPTVAATATCADGFGGVEVTITDTTPGFFYVFVQDVDYVTPLDGGLGTVRASAGPLDDGVHRVTVKGPGLEVIFDQDVTVDCAVTTASVTAPAVAAATASGPRFTG